MFPLLHIQDLYQIVDPEVPPPPTNLTDHDTNETTVNPSYVQWQKIDQLLFSWIIATLTEPILAQIVGLNTASKVRHSFESYFASNNAARVLQLRTQLHNLQKEKSTITDYLSRIKTISDSLADTAQPVSDMDLVLNALRGLGPEYDGFNTSITARPPLPTFIELYVLLLQQEIRIDHDNLH
ncbi:hypothetical protein MKX01_020350, partial [Papaver californicum]